MLKKSYQLITLIRWSPGTFRGSPLKHVCLSQSEGCVTLIEAETDEGLPQCYAQRHSLRSLRHQEELKFVEKFAPHFSLFEKNTIKEPTKYISRICPHTFSCLKTITKAYYHWKNEIWDIELASRAFPVLLYYRETQQWWAKVVKN